MKYVLDASAAIAFLRGEPGAEYVRDIFVDPASDVSIHTANMIEVHYKITAYGGERAANSAIADLTRLGVCVHAAIPNGMCSKGSTLKTRYPFLSLADCLGFPLAVQLKATALASDRPFANIKDDIKIRLIR